MFEHIYEEKKRTSKINAEKKRLTAIFKDIDEDKKKSILGLIENAAFQKVMLEELTLIIKRDGYVETYQNGATQSGLKKSAAVESYDKTLNTYSKIIKQICDLLPQGEANQPGADIMKFINGAK